jgi:hypothetical protein
VICTITLKNDATFKYRLEKLSFEKDGDVDVLTVSGIPHYDYREDYLGSRIGVKVFDKFAFLPLSIAPPVKIEFEEEK